MVGSVQVSACYFAVKKPINDDRAALSRTSRAYPRSFAIHDARSSVYGQGLRILK